jgi:formate dehydrogenase subunit delta
MNVDQKLIYMANQIATFFESQREEDGPLGVAIHINKFWEPRMRTKLFAVLDAGGEGLKPLVREAAPHIRRPGADPETGAGTGTDAALGAPDGRDTIGGEAKSETNFPEHPQI